MPGTSQEDGGSIGYRARVPPDTTPSLATPPPRFRRIAVYCGSNLGRRPEYSAAATDLGAFLADAGIGVVFGGGRVGLMGALANGALARGGEVIGVIPEKLRDLELAHTGVTELHVVDGMHPRKTKMADLSDAFIAMPGGFGTLEELFEVTTWAQLNYHLKPVGLLNVEGYYDKLLAFIEHGADEGFIRPIHRDLIVSATTASELLERLAAAEVPDIGRWIEER